MARGGGGRGSRRAASASSMDGEEEQQRGADAAAERGKVRARIHGAQGARVLIDRSRSICTAHSRPRMYDCNHTIRAAKRLAAAETRLRLLLQERAGEGSNAEVRG